jgi:HEPN domain-containing protein
MKDESDVEVLVMHAEDDFDMIARALRGKKPSTFGACFHAQQCAEKYIKAMLASKNVKFLLTHNLSVLSVQCVSADIKIDVDEKWLALLSAYAVAARYDRESPSLEDAKEAQKIAAEVRKFARKFLGLKK